MEVISVEDINRWNNILGKFDRHCIYYRPEYVESLLIEKGDKAYLFYFDGKFSALCFIAIISDLARCKDFENELSKGKVYDMETPYGYGGPLFDNVCEEDLETFRGELDEWARKNGVVSLFTRFNPIYGNFKDTENFFDEIRYMHHTTYIDTSNEELISKNMDPKCRNMIRKAIKNGVYIEIDEKLEEIDEFIGLYEETMDKHNAADMYYFPRKYYEYLRDKFIDNTILIKAKLDGKTIGAALFFYDDNEMHYHLSGADVKYKELACTNLILNEAALWAYRHGIKLFHLGGGITENDSLYRFKKKFNRNGELDFCIGKQIFDEEKYRLLLNIRKNTNPDFDGNNNRMIQYRA